MSRPLRIEYLGAYYPVNREPLRCIEQIRGMTSLTSIQKKTPFLFGMEIHAFSVIF